MKPCRGRPPKARSPAMVGDVRGLEKGDLGAGKAPISDESEVRYSNSFDYVREVALVADPKPEGASRMKDPSVITSTVYRRDR
ncbi:hypothetical protein Dimus_019811 [Dionaea muscipula]